MFQATSAVWRTASHTLWFTDLDLSAMETDWAPPTTFPPGDEEAYVVPPTYFANRSDLQKRHLMRMPEMARAITNL